MQVLEMIIIIIQYNPSILTYSAEMVMGKKRWGQICGIYLYESDSW